MSLVTKETDRSVTSFIKSVENSSKREDCELLISIMTELTGAMPKIWGSERSPDFIIGFGKYRYTQKGSNTILEWFRVGFVPRRNKFVFHFNIESEKSLFQELGKYKLGKNCLYINKLKDVNLDALIKIIDKSISFQEGKS